MIYSVIAIIFYETHPIFADEKGILKLPVLGSFRLIAAAALDAVTTVINCAYANALFRGIIAFHEV